MISPDFANFVTIAALIVVSCLITYLSSQRTLKRASEDARRQLELRFEGFTGALAALEVSVAQLNRNGAAPSAKAARARTPLARVAADATQTNGSGPPPIAKSSDQLPVEILVVIGAAVTSFLGKPVRIRSAKMLQSPYEIVNPWAQQGRATVQASHNLRSWNQ